MIRLANEVDAAAIAAVYAPYVTGTCISFEDAAPDEAEIARRIRGDRPNLCPWFVVDDGAKISGFASSAPFRTRPAYRWVVETGIYLAPDSHGRGIGRELLSVLLEALKRQGYVAAVGAIALPNPASVALHERLGFTHQGTYRQVGFKLGRWLDVGLWQKELAPRTASPSEPRAAEPPRRG